MEIYKKLDYYVFIAFISMSLNLFVLIITPPADNYEISIFEAYPYLFILLLAIPIWLGIVILISTSGFKIKSNFWKLGLLIIILGNLIVLLLPVFRGYSLYGRGDPLSHFGYINDIFTFGNIGDSNFYPISHILVVIISFISNLSSNQVMLISPSLFYIVYILGIFLLARQMTENYCEVICIVAFSGVQLFTYFGSQFLPTSFSLMIMPIILYFAFNRGNYNTASINYKLLLVIYLYYISVFHPVSLINLIIIFIVFWLYSIVSCSHGLYTNNHYFSYVNFSTIILLITCFLTWFSQFSIFHGTIYIVSNWFFYRLGEPPAVAYGKRLSEVSITSNDLIKYLIQGYSHEIVYSILSCLFILYIIYGLIKRDSTISNYTVIISALFIIFSLSTLVTHFGGVMISNPQRQFLYALMFSAILNGIMCFKIINTNSKWNIIYIILILLCCSFVGISSSYSTVLMGSVNSQVTQADLIGTSWFINYANYGTEETYSIHNEFHRFIRAKLGFRFENQAKIMMSFKEVPPMINISSIDSYYLMLSEYVITKFTVYWPDNPEFPERLIRQLDSNIQFNKIYNNRGVIFYLRGCGTDV